MGDCIFFTVFDPKTDVPGQTKTLMFPSDFFPGATKEMKFENALRKYAPTWEMRAFFIPALKNLSDEEIDCYLSRIDKRGI